MNFLILPRNYLYRTAKNLTNRPSTRYSSIAFEYVVSPHMKKNYAIYLGLPRKLSAAEFQHGPTDP